MRGLLMKAPFADRMLHLKQRAQPFVSRTGDVTPSGFLPLAAGNVRQARLVDIYRSSPLFVALRDVSGFKDRCGRCEYNLTCGGSRARAFVHTGDFLASDPLCPYVPPPTRATA